MEMTGFMQSPFFVLAVAVIAFWLGRATRNQGGDDREARQMQAVLDAEQRFSSLSPSKQAEVDRLLTSGKLIDAVKAIRTETGGGLKESKMIADSRRRQINGH